MKNDKIVRLAKHFFRLGPDAHEIVLEYEKLHGFKTEKEALDALLRENWHRELYIKYLLTRSDPSREEPACLRRFIFEGQYYCAKHAPIPHEIPTLDMCKACKLKVILRETKLDNPLPMMEDPPLVSDGNSETQDARPARPEVKEVYCRSQGGLYVKKSACDACTFKCPSFQQWFK